MKTIAIVIGISHFKEKAIEELPGAKVDASRFASALASWGISHDRVYLLVDENATKANIINTFYHSRPFFDADAKLIIYFAGHGVRTHDPILGIPESLLVLYDTSSQDLSSTGLRLVELMQLIRVLKPAQVFVFIDACSLRLDQVLNPHNNEEILSTVNSKGLFCLFSSGMNKSYENSLHQYGYFTNALLKTISHLRHQYSPNCHLIAQEVSQSLIEQSLPSPDVYHIGSVDLWPLESPDEIEHTVSFKSSCDLIHRKTAIAKLQDYLVSSPFPIIWMWGEAGLGKTVIAEQLSEQLSHMIYTSIPPFQSKYSGDTIHAILEQIILVKGELFFNHEKKRTFSETLNFLAYHQPHTVLIIDHLDRLPTIDLEQLIAAIDNVPLASVLISRYPTSAETFKQRENDFRVWNVDALNPEEIEQLITQNGLDHSLSLTLLTASKGNALKVRHILAKLIGEDIPLEGEFAQGYVNAVKAIASAGGFLDERLFCETFRVETNLLENLEKIGIIRYTNEGCFPHDTLVEMVHENRWELDLNLACEYWHRQILHTPYNLHACRSLVLLASQIDNCTSFKVSLGYCLEGLNKRESILFLFDLIKIFKKHRWENLLTRASYHLIELEEYHCAGEILSQLLDSKNPTIQLEASKNNARRLIWVSQSKECLESYSRDLHANLPSQIAYSLRNSIAIAYYLFGKVEEAKALFLENVHFKGKKDQRELGVAKSMLGLIVVYCSHSPAKARELFQSALQICESTKYHTWYIVALNGLSEICYRNQQWQQALYYLKKGAEIAEKTENRTFHLYTLRNIARNYLRLYGEEHFEVDAIIKTLENAVVDIRKSAEIWIIPRTLNTLATIYAHKKNSHKLKILTEELQLLTSDNQWANIFTLSNLGHLAALNQDFELAKKHYREAYQSAHEAKNQFAVYEMQMDFADLGFPKELQDFVADSYKDVSYKY